MTIKYVNYMQACARSYLLDVLEQAGGNVTRAAEIAGKSRTYFYQLLSQHDIVPGERTLPVMSTDRTGNPRIRFRKVKGYGKQWMNRHVRMQGTT